MPEKVKVSVGNIEENDVKQIAEAIGKFLNYEVNIEKGKEEYKLYLKDRADHDEKEYLLGFILRGNGTTDHYTMLLLFDVFLPAYIIKGGPLSIQEYNNIKQKMLPKEEKSSIVEEMKRYLEKQNLEITFLEFGRVSVTLGLRKKTTPP
ncbi:MAG: hypothetical protein RXR32_01900 [Candidatus Micrarchaeota archaeon]